MGDDKSSSSIVMASRDREPRDRELLIPVADSGDEDASSKPSSSSSSHHTGRETFPKLLEVGHQKSSRQDGGSPPNAQEGIQFRHSLIFCSVILFPIAVTFYIMWWFIHFVDGFFSPIYAQLGIDIFVIAKVLYVMPPH